MMFQQKQADRGQLMRRELSEAFDHAMRAASHAASGVQASMGPRVGPTAQRFRKMADSRLGSARAMLMPLNEPARRESKEQAGKRAQRRTSKRRGQKHSRWPRMIGLLGGGVAVGAGAAYIMRKRRQREWDEYDPTEVLETAEAPIGGTTAATPSAGPPGTAQGKASPPGGAGTGASGGTPGASSSAGQRTAGSASGTVTRSAGATRPSPVESGGPDTRRPS